MIFYLILICILCQANDNTQLNQKFICLADGSKITLDDKQRNYLAVIKSVFDDMPDKSEFYSTMNLTAYETLRKFIQSDGKVIPDETMTLNELFHNAAHLEIRKDLLRILSDKIVECNNFKSLPYDDQRILTSDYLSRLKYTQLINADLNNDAFPYIDVSTTQTKLHLISKFAYHIKNNDSWIFGPTQTIFYLYYVPTLLKQESTTITEKTLQNALLYKFPLKALIQKNSRAFLKHNCKVFKVLNMIFVFENEWLHLIANGTVIDMQAFYFQKIVKVCGDKKQNKLYLLFHEYNNDINNHEEKFGTCVIQEWPLVDDQNIGQKRTIFKEETSNQNLDMIWDKVCHHLSWCFQDKESSSLDKVKVFTYDGQKIIFFFKYKLTGVRYSKLLPNRMAYCLYNNMTVQWSLNVLIDMKTRNMKELCYFDRNYFLPNGLWVVRDGKLYGQDGCAVNIPKIQDGKQTSNHYLQQIEKTKLGYYFLRIYDLKLLNEGFKKLFNTPLCLPTLYNHLQETPSYL